MRLNGTSLFKNIIKHILLRQRLTWLKDACTRHNLMSCVGIENHRQRSLHKRKQPAIHCAHEFSDSFPSLPTFVYLKFYFPFVYVTLEWEKESNSPNKTPLSLKTLWFRSMFYDFSFYVVAPLIFIFDLILWTSNKTVPVYGNIQQKCNSRERLDWKQFGKVISREEISTFQQLFGTSISINFRLEIYTLTS